MDAQERLLYFSKMFSITKVGGNVVVDSVSAAGSHVIYPTPSVRRAIKDNFQSDERRGENRP